MGGSESKRAREDPKEDRNSQNSHIIISRMIIDFMIDSEFAQEHPSPEVSASGSLLARGFTNNMHSKG